MRRIRTDSVWRTGRLPVLISILFLAFLLPSVGGTHPTGKACTPDDTRGGSWTFGGDQVSSLDSVADRRVMESITVKDRAVLYINSSLVNVTQDHPDQFSIEVRDTGRIVLNGGTITSNMAIRMYLNDSATLSLSSDSKLQISNLMIDGRGTAFILDDSSILGVNTTVTKVGELFISSVGESDGITELSVGACMEEVSISGSGIRDLVVDSCENVSITDSSVGGDTWFRNCRGRIEIKNCTIEAMNVQATGTLKATDSLLLNMVVVACKGDGYGNGVLLYNCTVKDVIIDSAPAILVRGGEVSPSGKGYLDNLCSVDDFQAEDGTIFTYPLSFSGGTRAVLANITTSGIDVKDKAEVALYNWHETTGTSPVFKTPQLTVEAEGIIRLYRSLFISVTDREGKPVKGAEVRVLEDIGNVSLYSGFTDQEGKIVFCVLGSMIEEGEENFIGYYRTEVLAGGGRKTVVRTNTTTMVDRLSIVVALDTVIEEEEGNKIYGSVWLWTGLLLLAILTVMTVMAIKSRRKR